MMTRQRGNTTLIIGGMLLDDNSSWTSPTLDLDFTTVGLFELQFVRPGHGYRMNENGDMALVEDTEAVIAKDSDE